MNRTLIAVGVLVGAFAGGMFGNAIAHSEPSSSDYAQYVNDLTNAGITVPATNIIKAGVLTCFALQEGETATQLINEISSGENALPASVSVAIVGYAIADLCPEYGGSKSGTRVAAPSQPAKPVPVTIAGFTRPVNA